MGCCIYRPKCNIVWSVWYCIFVLLIHAYLVYLGIQRYRLYNEMDWTVGHRPNTYLYIYIGLHALVIAASPFFIAFSLFKTGNLASDNERLGQRTDRTLVLEPNTCCPRKLKSMWLHGPPAAQTVHLIMAFAILMAQQLMVGKLYEDSHFKSEDTWNTELDFAYQGAERLSKILPTNISKYHRGYFMGNDLQRVSENNPKLLPLLVNQKMFGVNLEFLNYFVALLIFAIVYPSVFWRTSRCFAFVFSAQLVLHAFTAIYSYIDFSVLFRIHLLAGRTNNFPPIPPNIKTVSDAFLLPNQYCVLGSYLLGVVTMYFASTVLYAYGYTRYCISWQRMVQQRSWVESSQTEKAPGTRNQPGRVGCCEGYCPHLMAIVLLILLVGAKILILYDTMLIFLNEWPKPLALSCVVVDVVYLFTWILLWLFLTCKRTWGFKVTYTVPEMLCLMETEWTPGTGWSRYKKPVVDPNNAMILMTGNEIYVTENPAQKATILRQAHKYGLGSPKEEVYWLRPQNATSPMDNRRQALNERKNSQEVNHLLQSQGGYQSEPEHQSEYLAYASERRAGPSVALKQQQHHQQQQQQQLQQRQQSLQHVDSRVSGSYLRFADVDGGAPMYEDSQRAHDLATTFGTLPRSEYKRRRMVPGAEADFHYPATAGYSGSGIRTRQGSDGAAMETYASIHKSRPSPTPSGLQSSRDYVRLTGGLDNVSNASRQSSYANIPGARGMTPQQGLRIQQQMRDMRAPPQARVISVGGSLQSSVSGSDGQHRVAVPPSMGSQQSTPQSTRAYVGLRSGPQDQQSVYASVNGGDTIVSSQQYSTASVTQVRQSPQSQRAKVSAYPAGGGAAGMHQPDLGAVYGRTQPVKLSSFTDISKAGGSSANEPIYQTYGTVGGADQHLLTGQKTPSREATPQSNASSTLTRMSAQQQHVHWQQNPAYGNLQQQQQQQQQGQDNFDSNLTPTSTLTSQGSYTITPTPGSPLESGGTTSGSSSAHTYSAMNGNEGALHHHNGQHHPSTNGRHPFGGGGRKESGGNGAALGRNTHVSTNLTVNGVYDRGNDSANYSLTSSNDSEQQNQGQFATSIV